LFELVDGGSLLKQPEHRLLGLVPRARVALTRRSVAFARWVFRELAWLSWVWGVAAAVHGSSSAGVGSIAIRSVIKSAGRGWIPPRETEAANSVTSKIDRSLLLAVRA